jgi:hypothetical protein
LGAGRRDLDDHIRRLERSLAQADADATASADSVLSRIRQGLSWSIVPGKPVPDYSKELQIARTALAKLDSERAAKEAQLEAIGARVASAGKRVLHEHAEGVKNAYAFAVEELRERAAQLIALNRLTGSHEGRVCFDIPNFTGRREFAPLRIEESHINGARAVWANLMATWHSNPFAEPKPAFPRHDPGSAEELIYHERSATERAIIDAEFSAANH